jgi:hypothetical protein
MGVQVVARVPEPTILATEGVFVGIFLRTSPFTALQVNWSCNYKQLLQYARPIGISLLSYASRD